jgi:hypothetical protein
MQEPEKSVIFPVRDVLHAAGKVRQANCSKRLHKVMTYLDCRIGFMIICRWSEALLCVLTATFVNFAIS